MDEGDGVLVAEGPKGQYINGHEHDDVVEYQQKFYLPHSMEVMVYQYDKLFGYGCWMTSIPTMNQIGIFCCIIWGTVIFELVGMPNNWEIQSTPKIQKCWDTSHPTTVSKKFIILIYHYLHAVPAIAEIRKRTHQWDSEGNEDVATSLHNGPSVPPVHTLHCHLVSQ